MTTRSAEIYGKSHQSWKCTHSLVIVLTYSARYRTCWIRALKVCYECEYFHTYIHGTINGNCYIHNGSHTDRSVRARIKTVTQVAEKYVQCATLTFIPATRCVHLSVMRARERERESAPVSLDCVFSLLRKLCHQLKITHSKHHFIWRGTLSIFISKSVNAIYHGARN